VAPSTIPPGRAGSSIVRSNSSWGSSCDFDPPLCLPLFLFFALLLLGEEVGDSVGLEGSAYTNRLCVVAIMRVVEENVASYISCVVCIGCAARPSKG